MGRSNRKRLQEGSTNGDPENRTLAPVCGWTWGFCTTSLAPSPTGSVKEFEGALISLGSDAVDFPLRVDELFADAGGQSVEQRIRAISRVPAAHTVAA